MTLNIGQTDRRIRYLLAIGLALAAFFLTSGTPRIVLAVVAVVLVATASVGTCPAYLPFGLSTRRGANGDAA